MKKIGIYTMISSVTFVYVLSLGLSVRGQLDCSAIPQDGGTDFQVGQFILLQCDWATQNVPSNLVSNGSGSATPSSGNNGPATTSSTPENSGATDGANGADLRPELAWFRREVSGHMRELSASHAMEVKWRLAEDDNGIEFVCATTNGTEILSSPMCELAPLVIQPQVRITSSPGTHAIGESNTFTCEADGEPDIRTYDWFVNGVQVYPEHDSRFTGDSHILVDDENEHLHRHLTFDRLNATDNGTRITCVAWTTTNISSNATYTLNMTDGNSISRSSLLKESVVLIACLSAGGAPVLFLVCVCIVWSVLRARKRKRAKYDTDYMDSSSFKSEENIRAAKTDYKDPNSSLPHQYHSNNAHGHGTTAGALQRPNFFMQKLNRLSQMFFAPARHQDEESIYENAAQLQTTFQRDLELGKGSPPITRGGSLQLPPRPTVMKSLSAPHTPMSAPLALTTTRNDPDQEYENFAGPKRDYENTPSILDSPSSPGW